ncbi:undecaprenyldiphospho-muramoylpentapeptide beta-N-acetylglucosaminyltransferase [Bartonella sp. DGB1]|uniref:undecaprenyldiphospho-muramoylpentapeptide beta-N-acetylglucosaminyltransferase n=1 Tax=Bartonella sp. DGB1 TaxID=3239807 RepID=UPI0035269D6E
MKNNNVIILVAGGTGGHLFPAQSLAEELRKEKVQIILFTDNRAKKFVNSNVFDKIYALPAATINSKNPVKIIKTIFTLMKGLYKANQLIKKYKPKLLVGFGGYPTLAPVFAARLNSIPTLIHEQNKVMGRANKLLSRWVKAIALGFPLSDNKYSYKTLVTGIPLREEVLKQLPADYNIPNEEEKFNLLIFGGSQGASFFTEIFAETLPKLDKEILKKFSITQQVRNNHDYQKLNKIYSDLGLQFELSEFFTNMPLLMKKAHFIISRAGASTVTEISAMGRPALLIPFPHALDHDQALNAEYLVESGAITVIKENDLNVEKLIYILTNLLTNSEKFKIQAKNLYEKSPADINKNLFKLTQGMMNKKSIDIIKKDLKL